jgi:hypothetical protein
MFTGQRLQADLQALKLKIGFQFNLTYKIWVSGEATHLLIYKIWVSGETTHSTYNTWVMILPLTKKGRSSLFIY